ncbi:MAG TPA: hypothetical protein VGH12_07230 [Steroidobacteraceae bacterium]
MNAPTAALGELQGVWRRSSIGWPDGRCDTETQVYWLQGPSFFADLRQPASMADFSHVRSLADLSHQDCLSLARQEGFAGHLTFDGRHFEWHRKIDFQPKGKQADVGSLRWQKNVLIEAGRDLPYVEHWHRDPMIATQPAAAALLRHRQLGTSGILVRGGEYYIFSRDRAVELNQYSNLAEYVAAARTLEDARALVDCEISFARVTNDAIRITASTLPHRVGCNLGGLDSSWEILKIEGDPGALRAILWLNR